MVNNEVDEDEEDNEVIAPVDDACAVVGTILTVEVPVATALAYELEMDGIGRRDMGDFEDNGDLFEAVVNLVSNGVDVDPNDDDINDVDGCDTNDDVKNVSVGKGIRTDESGTTLGGKETRLREAEWG